MDVYYEYVLLSQLVGDPEPRGDCALRPCRPVHTQAFHTETSSRNMPGPTGPDRKGRDRQARAWLGHSGEVGM